MEWRAFHNYQKSGWSCLRKLGKEKKEKKEKKQVFPQGRIKAFPVRPSCNPLVSFVFFSFCARSGFSVYFSLTTFDGSSVRSCFAR